MPRVLRFDDRMPDWLHVGLVNHLQTTMKPRDCRGTHDHTKAFLQAHHFNVEDGIDWLEEHHAGCDCEVVINTHPTIDEM